MQRLIPALATDHVHHSAQIVCLSIIALWVAQAALAAFQTYRQSRQFRFKVRRLREAYRPHVTIIMPIKGVDVDLPGCVRGLCTQEYPDYDVVIVVESQDDPAYSILQAELAQYRRHHPRVLIAGRAGPDVGQKVHNHLHAIDALAPAADDEDVWVFADSDAIPGPRWLVDLVSMLVGRHKYGVTTGYRWLVPDERRPAAFASRLASVINASIACTYRRGGTDQAWGGAMAMRVEIARKGELRKRLTGALTDDYPVTRMCRDLGLRVRFIQRCLAATPVDFTFRSFFSFGRRQYLITRVYSPGLYAAALAIITFWCAGFLTAWTHFLINLLVAPAAGWWRWSAGAIVAVFLLNQLRASLRTRIVRVAFGDAMVRRLRATQRVDRWLTPVWMFVHAAVIWSALLGRRFIWRGIRYRLDGPQKVRRLDAPP